MKDPKFIPRHEPEVIDAATKRRRLGEHVGTSSLFRLDIDGVMLLSRHSKAEELEVMQRMLRSVPAPLRQKIDSVFCDSQAQAVYTVEFREGDLNEALVIAHWLERGAGRHNGILLVGPTFKGRIGPGGL